MKKVLMLCFLLVAIAGATPALAAPFAFGPSTFDDQAELLDNLKTLVPSGSGTDFEVLPNNDILGSPPMYVKLIGLSEKITTNGIFLTVQNGNDYLADSRDLSGYWNADSTQHTVSDTRVDVYRDDGMTRLYGGSLDMILNGRIYGVTAVGAYYFGGDAVVYQPDGYAPITLYGGTTFIGISFGSSNKVDAILPLSYLPMNAVPVPAAVWLLGSGLAGIVALRKRMA